MSSLKTIKIDELVPGMYVNEIIEQSGAIKIKSQGRVTRLEVVDTLRKRGVKRLTIDLDKQFTPEQPAEIVAETAPVDVAILEQEETVSFSKELVRAENIHKKGKRIQKRLLEAVQNGLPFDDKIPREFSQSLVSSIHRNPDALLCLTKIREKDDYLLEHSLNVAILLANFGKFIGMSAKEVEDLAYAGFLHDMGKIRIPDEILHKPGRLTNMEMNVMKDHVYFGVTVLEEMNIAPHLIRTVSEHHERLDGYGYPNGSRGEQISRAGRMLAIADVYDALTADRCYKAGMSSQKALQILLGETPDKLDKELVQLFIKCMGIYPVGSLVKLSNDRIAMVVQQTQSPLAPVVKAFYSLRGGHFLEPKDFDLSSGTELKIERAVLAKDYKINFNAYFEKIIAT
ncbi:HD-GYP domain-containing protein [Alteromonas pelagimontana]|uniref:HD-GYP domain-containing protein n=1 Tax=Alteromonas pelagimontana TaxID=1858656 RepID=A0A6M4MCU9_9ALTE|nr:HD-GYP domain-containing protein [Alteromonas pelagimontana]QJR80953.1 HD-GYP domain-containing protein [Alteromonas pelagimontana]